jgi:hypothetical protein
VNDDPFSAQSLAVEWLLEQFVFNQTLVMNDTITQNDYDTLAQTYALAALYISLGQDLENYAPSPCDWDGIDCNIDGRVESVLISIR